MTTRTIQCNIKGRVQGVSFRYFAKKLAEELGVAGSVRNLPGGAVEVIAQGEESGLSKFLERLQNGPDFAEVNKIEIKKLKNQPSFNSFEIIR